MRVDVSLV